MPREKASEFFGHIVLLMIGESLSETLETRNDPSHLSICMIVLVS